MRGAITAGLAVLPGAGSLPALAHQIALKDLEIVHPNAMEPSSSKIKDVMIFMTIHNRGKRSDRILSASSPLAKSVVIENGSPAGEPGIVLPAGGTVAFKREGAHIEIKGLTEELTGYETFPLWLTFEKAGKVEIEVMVEANEDALDSSKEEKRK